MRCLQIIYRWLRPLLFLLPPELAHAVALNSLRLLYQLRLFPRELSPSLRKPKKLFGLVFPNAVGLAAGLDKNGDYIEALLALGFGFVEVGTATPKPQPGNPKPRLFRLPSVKALINRLGFNNKGVDYLVRRLQQRKMPGIVGVNIGKNFTTPLESAYHDYEICLEKVYPYADYVTINISSPNTPGLRELQKETYLYELLNKLKTKQLMLAEKHHRQVPLLLKISPDLNLEELEMIARVAVMQQIEGIIATNTTQQRRGVEELLHGKEAGGLSGKPLFPLTLQVVRQLKGLLAGQIPVIAVGGISSLVQAKALMEAGAELVQIYTAFIYEGPGLINDLLTF